MFLVFSSADSSADSEFLKESVSQSPKFGLKRQLLYFKPILAAILCYYSNDKG